MTNYIFHTAGERDRWDTIAYKYYGNSYKIQNLISDNPHIPITGTIEEGTEVRVRVEETTPDDNSNLPIWKRN